MSGSLQAVLDGAFDAIAEAREGFAATFAPREVGAVVHVATGVAKVSGLPGVGFEELVEFSGGVSGIAFNVDAD